MAPSMGLRDGPVFDVLGNGVLQRRNAVGSGSEASLSPVSEAAQASAGSSALYVGVGVGIGVLIFLLVGVLGGLIWRKRARHKRQVAEIDPNGTPVRMRRSEEVSEVPRPPSTARRARRSTLVPRYARAGWGALSSNETVHQSQPVSRDRKNRDSVALPKKLKQRTIPLRRLKHLSAIMESPRSRSGKSPSPARRNTVGTPVRPPSAGKSMLRKTITMVHPAERDEDVFTAPGSPRLDVLPSFAIRSPGMYGAAIANDDRAKVLRSVSVGAMPHARGSTRQRPSNRERPHMHVRSLSLGAPPSQPPPGPVPPLPERSMLRDILNAANVNRRPVLIPRLSSSSGQSADSSVLITSPILTLRDDCHKQLGLPLPSPTVEQVVAEDEGAQLKSVTVMNRQWQNPRIIGPRPTDEPRLDESKSALALVRPRLERNPASVRSDMATYSTTSDLLEQRLSAASVDSEDSQRRMNRLSVPQIGTAARLSVSRVASSNSIPGVSNAGVQKVKVTTPRNSPRHSVSADGSPAERDKKLTRSSLGTSATTSVLQSISHNAVSRDVSPTRQTSYSTQSSGESSNGNPFQWDQSMPPLKPSALKGSPNAKGTKGHRRQNCVRISTLTPQILGPPPSRPSSAAFMDGIEEEHVEDFKSDAEAGLRFISSQQNRLSLQRAPSTSSLAPVNPRVETLRASSTPSSPTLSAWTAWQHLHGENKRLSGLPSQLSDSQLSRLSVSDTTTRTVSRQSSVSALSIPSFPLPSHSAVVLPSLSRDVVVVPEFSLQRPSTDSAMPQSSSPFALHMSSDDVEGDEDEPTDLPSSPPLPISKTQEYNPAWPMLHIPKRGAREYDPNSPGWPDSAIESQNADQADQAGRRSPSYFPPTAPGGVDQDECLSPRGRPSNYFGESLPDTPPCSPKTIPEGFRDLFGGIAHTCSIPIPVEQRGEALREPRPRGSLEKLTSANASAIMATIPEVPPRMGFPTAVPILAPPPSDINLHATPMRPSGRNRLVTSTSRLQSMHPSQAAPLPGQAPTAIMVAPSSSAAAIDSSPLPPPLQIHTRADSNGSVRSSVALRGPRSEPGKSVLKNALALRRMNSELDVTTRSDRRYTHLNREPSPLLPWIGTPDVESSESFNDLFDFELADRNFDQQQQTSAGAAADNSSDTLYAHNDYTRGALDEIDFQSLDRTIDGALAGLQHGPPSTASLRSRASIGVWEEGDKFWSTPGGVDDKENRHPNGASGGDFKLEPRSPIDISTTSMNVKTGSGSESVVASTKRGGAGGGYDFGLYGEESRPNSISKTPRSLYDSDGFLRAGV
ncbi:hypothetical protein Tdes44962_MAKER02179 [Teratosphaeria destructans]|uniref:Uncharacterized protein n=1 Tax=Teratosphaeria destructans TaxID=418781 RepID=A0A9W7W410_9PEZI|nr:hypothetical protein Tdes44962_MAKER02179 [Teratosphaeria destructans]